MSDLFNLKSLKEAKILVPHIDAILTVINLSIKSLEHFKHYTPVINILNVMKQEKIVLEAYKNKYGNIVKNKGKINN